MSEVECPVCEQPGTRNPELDHDDTCVECQKEIGLISALDRIYTILDSRD